MAERKHSMNRKRMQTWRSGDSGIPRLVGFSSRPGEAETVAYLTLLASPGEVETVAYLALLASPADLEKRRQWHTWPCWLLQQTWRSGDSGIPGLVGFSSRPGEAETVAYLALLASPADLEKWRQWHTSPCWLLQQTWRSGDSGIPHLVGFSRRSGDSGIPGLVGFSSRPGEAETVAYLALLASPADLEKRRQWHTWPCWLLQQTWRSGDSGIPRLVGFSSRPGEVETVAYLALLASPADLEKWRQWHTSPCWLLQQTWRSGDSGIPRLVGFSSRPGEVETVAYLALLASPADLEKRRQWHTLPCWLLQQTWRSGDSGIPGLVGFSSRPGEAETVAYLALLASPADLEKRRQWHTLPCWLLQQTWRSGDSGIPGLVGFSSRPGEVETVAYFALLASPADLEKRRQWHTWPCWLLQQTWRSGDSGIPRPPCWLLQQTWRSGDSGIPRLVGFSSRPGEVETASGIPGLVGFSSRSGEAETVAYLVLLASPADLEKWRQLVAYLALLASPADLEKRRQWHTSPCWLLQEKWRQWHTWPCWLLQQTWRSGDSGIPCLVGFSSRPGEVETVAYLALLASPADLEKRRQWHTSPCWLLQQTWRSGDSGIPRLVGFSSRPGEAETVAYLALLASPADLEKRRQWHTSPCWLLQQTWRSGDSGIPRPPCWLLQQTWRSGDSGIPGLVGFSSRPGEVETVAYLALLASPADLEKWRQWHTSPCWLLQQTWRSGDSGIPCLVGFSSRPGEAETVAYLALLASPADLEKRRQWHTLPCWLLQQTWRSGDSGIPRLVGFSSRPGEVETVAYLALLASPADLEKRRQWHTLPCWLLQQTWRSGDSGIPCLVGFSSRPGEVETVAYLALLASPADLEKRRQWHTWPCWLLQQTWRSGDSGIPRLVGFSSRPGEVETVAYLALLASPADLEKRRQWHTLPCWLLQQTWRSGDSGIPGLVGFSSRPGEAETVAYLALLASPADLEKRRQWHTWPCWLLQQTWRSGDSGIPRPPCWLLQQTWRSGDSGIPRLVGFSSRPGEVETASGIPGLVGFSSRSGEAETVAYLVLLASPADLEKWRQLVAYLALLASPADLEKRRQWHTSPCWLLQEKWRQWHTWPCWLLQQTWRSGDSGIPCLVGFSSRPGEVETVAYLALLASPADLEKRRQWHTSPCWLLQQTWRSGDSGIPRLVGFSSRPGEAETVAYLALLASPADLEKRRQWHTLPCWLLQQTWRSGDSGIPGLVGFSSRPGEAETVAYLALLASPADLEKWRQWHTSPCWLLQQTWRSGDSGIPGLVGFSIRPGEEETVAYLALLASLADLEKRRQWHTSPCWLLQQTWRSGDSGIPRLVGFSSSCK